MTQYQPIQCIAQEELACYPKSVHVLHHPFANVLVVAVTHDNDALRFATRRKKSFFTIAELPTPNPSGEPMRVIRVPSPAAVTSLTLVRSLNGEDVFVIVQCTKSSGATRAVQTYLYRRTVEEDEENEEASRGGDSSSAGRPYSASPSRRAATVVYQRLTRVLDSTTVPWSAAACLQGWERAQGMDNGERTTPTSHAHYIAAASITESSTALHLVSVTGPKARVHLTVELDALSRFPVRQIVPLPGAYPMRFLCVCHNSLVDVNLERHASPSPVTGQSADETIVTTSNAVLTRAWRCAPEVSLTCCAMRDCHIIAGTSSGSLLLWDFRDERVTAATNIEGSTAPVTGIHATDASTFLSCSLDGTLLCWMESPEAYGSHQPATGGGDHVLYQPGIAAQRFPYVSHPVNGECSSLSGEGWVGMAGDGNLVAIIGEFGTLQLFLRV